VLESLDGPAPEASRPEAETGAGGRVIGPRGALNLQFWRPSRAVDFVRRDRVVPMASVRALGAAMIAHFDRLSADNLLPYLPRDFGPVASGQH